MRQTPGDSLDRQLNREGKHWIIKVETVGDAIKLAKAFKEQEPRTFSKKDVMYRLAVSLQEKRISADRINAVLLKKLIEDGYLGVVAQEPTSSVGAEESKSAAATEESKPAGAEEAKKPEGEAAT